MNPLETSLTGKTGTRDTASETLIRGIFPIVIYCGGYSAGAPPLPIPNREVKPGRADGTAPPGGRVGRCRFCKRRLTARDSVSSASSLFIPAPLLLSRVPLFLSCPLFPYPLPVPPGRPHPLLVTIQYPNYLSCIASVPSIPSIPSSSSYIRIHSILPS